MLRPRTIIKKAWHLSAKMDQQGGVASICKIWGMPSAIWKKYPNRAMAECVAGFAGLLAQSHLHQAIQLFGAADACMTASGMQRNPFHQQDVDQLRALAHLQLDTETFVTLFTRGTNIPIEQVVTDILDEHLPYRR